MSFKKIHFGEINEIKMGDGKRLGTFENQGDYHFTNNVKVSLDSSNNIQEFYNKFPYFDVLKNSLDGKIIGKDDEELFSMLRNKAIEICSQDPIYEKFEERFDELPESFGFLIMEE